MTFVQKLLRALLVTSVAPGLSLAASPWVAQAGETSHWQVYRSEPYGFELRYPPNYVIVTPKDQLQPPPLFRVWFQEASVAGSPLGERQPPEFAVDVYANAGGRASERLLEAWLTKSGVVRSPERFDRDATQVGGVTALRLTGRALVAPNVFYYVAHGAFVYRFAPLGPLAEQMLHTVSFLR